MMDEDEELCAAPQADAGSMAVRERVGTRSGSFERREENRVSTQNVSCTSN